MNEGRDKLVCRRVTERYRELAGMLKEKSKGTLITLEKIVTRFSIQEGLRPSKAKIYLNQLIKVGIIVITSGKKRWKYNSDAEWELFRIQI